MIKNNFFKKILLIFLAFFVFLSNTSFAKELRIVQFSDIHIDTTRENGSARKYAYSLNMFQKAIIKVNAINPDIVVFSGDMVNSPREKDFDIFLKIWRAKPEFCCGIEVEGIYNAIINK